MARRSAMRSGEIDRLARWLLEQGARTLGGFDRMTAIVGGFWDSLLGEGRRFWIVATSDSHVNYTEVRGAAVISGPASFTRRMCMREAVTMTSSTVSATDACLPWPAIWSRA